jgi:hypothetical protein
MNSKFEIIETPDYILAVSDEEPTDGNIALHPNGTVGILTTALAIALFKETNKGSYVEDCKKIIAYQPKSNAPELDLLLLPEMVVEDYSLEAAKKFAQSKFENLKEKYPSGKGVTSIQAILDTLNVGVECGYKFASKASKIVIEDDVEKFCWRLFGGSFEARGVESEEEADKTVAFGIECYKAATKVYSEEDLRKAIEMAKEGSIGYYAPDSPVYYFEHSENKIIQSLKQPKTPKWFVAEIKHTKSEVFRENDNVPYAVLKTTTINGKTYLVGTYLY